LEYVYDNSSGNPHNPSNPPVRVRFGEQTKDEMALAFLAIVLPSPDDVQPFQRALVTQYLDAFISEANSLDDLPPQIPGRIAQQLRAALLLFDRNHNGKLDPDEREAVRNLVQAMLPR